MPIKRLCRNGNVASIAGLEVAMFEAALIWYAVAGILVFGVIVLPGIASLTPEMTRMIGNRFLCTW
jgi:hypothetical protein